jgi:hypothetical protein
VVSASQYPNSVIGDLVNKSMRLIDASGPTTLQFVFQRFRFARAREGFSLNLTNQANDTKRLRSILVHPPGEILKRGNVKVQASQ